MNSGPSGARARRLCSALAGVEEVSERLATTALTHARDELGADVDALVATYEQGGLDAVRRSSHVDHARSITYFLYTGQPAESEREDRPGADTMDEVDYFESVVWRVVQAHPRALSGGYYGQWHYPPEDDDGGP